MHLRPLPLGVMLLLCSILLPTLLSAQIRNRLNLDQETPSPFDTLVDEIRVPEIDPRQYILIYEWNPSNERKYRGGIKDEYRMREAERYASLYKQELDALDDRLLISGNELSSIEERIQENVAILDTLSSTASFERSNLYDQLDAFYRERTRIEESIDLIQQEIDEILLLVKDNEYVADYLKWQYNEESDTSKYKRSKPFDFFDDTDVDYAGKLRNYEEYYNEIVWRNAGTPDWEPIWWLNQYPWPNMDYRNIDLIDQDYRDQHFALIPYQKYEVVDRKAVLRIVFDKTQLARNEHFKGSIGLDAFLYEGTSDGSQGGDPREIEINPYSVIGEERKSIGLLNLPASELADNLIILIKKSGEISDQMRGELNLFNYSANSKAAFDLFEININEALNTYRDTNLTDSLKKVLIVEKLLEVCNTSSILDYITPIDEDPYFSAFCSGYDLELRIDLVLEQRLVGLLSAVQGDNGHKSEYQGKRDDLRNSRQGLRLILTYLNYFNKEVGNTRDAFLSLIGKDEINYNYLLGRLNSEIKNLDVILSSVPDELPAPNSGANIDVQLESVRGRIRGVLDEISDIRGSLFHQAIGKLVETYPDRFSLDDNDDIPFDFFEFNHLPKEGGELHYFLEVISINPKLRGYLREYLAEKAGEILYQDLLYGTIDLDLADAKDGDLLFVRMYWDKEPIAIDNQDFVNFGEEPFPKASADTTNTTTTNNTTDNDDNTNGSEDNPVTPDAPASETGSAVLPPPSSPAAATTSPQRDGVALYVAKFQLTDRGWHAKTTENFMLVNRVNEDLLPSSYPLNSTQFNPTGGISLTWGLRNDYRVNKRIKFDRQTNLPLFTRKGNLKYNRGSVFFQRTFKWMEPSFGVNFTYLNFREGQNFEVGVGPTIGLFNNTFYLSTGWNLMELKDRPFYLGIGASILNLGTKVNKAVE